MPQGRIILKSICQSKKLAMLNTDGARLLYTWLIPNLDVNGCFSGDPKVIKGQIFTRLRKTERVIAKHLEDLQSIGLIILYETNRDVYLCVPDFAEKQPSINPQREGKSNIPQPTPEQLQSYTRATPPEVKRSKAKQNKSKVKHLDFVFLTSEEHKKLTIRYGEKQTHQLIDSLNRYIGQSGKKYKSHYYTLLGFAKREDMPELKHPKEDAATEQKAREKKRQEIRKEFGQYYREQKIEALRSMRKNKLSLSHWWLIDEILAKKK